MRQVGRRMGKTGDERKRSESSYKVTILHKNPAEI